MSDEGDETELKHVDSMPGSINQFISTNRRLKRPPSLSESFAWTPENIERAYTIPLIVQEQANQQELEKQQTTYEQIIVEVTVKLLLHITLISVFETIFYFFYVSSLENNGIEKTVNTFINSAATTCTNLTTPEIEIVDYFLEQYINASLIIAKGNAKEISRSRYNETIINMAWSYVGALLGLSLITLIYIKKRRLVIPWKYIISENVAMVCLLALYELMFFNTIIYEYEPISTDEIARDAIEKFQKSCGLLTVTNGGT
jgi:hypothetical protein